MALEMDPGTRIFTTLPGLSDSSAAVSGIDARCPCLVWGTRENKACSVNAASWFPLPMPWPISPAGLALETPQRAFTQADHVNLLVSAREADADLGFMARTMLAARDQWIEPAKPTGDDLAQIPRGTGRRPRDRCTSG